MSHGDTNSEKEFMCDIPDVTQGLKLRKGAHMWPLERRKSAPIPYWH